VRASLVQIKRLSINFNDLPFHNQVIIKIKYSLTKIYKLYYIDFEIAIDFLGQIEKSSIIEKDNLRLD